MTKNIPSEPQYPHLLPGEQVLWERTRTKRTGFLRRKEIVIGYEIVTTRALRVVTTRSSDALDLSKIESVVITDRHSKGEGSYRGVSIGVPRSGVRVSQGGGRGQSRPLGDINFIDNQHGIVYTLNDVVDAQGVKNLIKSIFPHIK